MSFYDIVRHSIKLLKGDRKLCSAMFDIIFWTMAYHVSRIVQVHANGQLTHSSCNV